MGVYFKNNSNKIIILNINLVKSRIDDITLENLRESKSLENAKINNIKKENINHIKSLNKDNEKNLNEIKSLEKSEYVNLKLQVKSKFMIEQIFQYLNEKERLLLLRYNKYYQKILGINIESYMKISGKIKLGEKNGYGKEYDLSFSKLIFKGYYKNGKRNGKGEEFKYNTIIFEGEYINGKRNGKGKEYNLKGNLEFEGEYKDGKRWNGKIKEYDDEEDKLKFEGEYLEGKKLEKNMIKIVI